jgi:hypothetical protein
LSKAETTPPLRRLPDWELTLGLGLLGAALVFGLFTAQDYGISIDEFNADDYGPKALAWYTSGFSDRSHFETVEFSLWYYGPWFHMLTAFVQSFELADRFTVRHAMTFLVGLGGVAALLPLGRLVGRGTGLIALTLCLMTGYLYGSLFFTPIDVPFLAAMTWAILAITKMSDQALPSWKSVTVAGLFSGLAIATRTGGIITQGYLALALILCAAPHFAEHGRLPRGYLLQLGSRYFVAGIVASIVAVTLWPWLQIANPFKQFLIAHQHFLSIPMSFEFPHWGERISTDALPRFYIATQLAARLPEAFLFLLVIAAICCAASVWLLTREILYQRNRRAAVRQAARRMAQHRYIILIATAALLPIAFLMIQRPTMYDGVRHVLFIIPMLAVLAGVGFTFLLPAFCGPAAPLIALLVGLYGGSIIFNLAKLHPLQYVAMNAFAGGVRGAYGRFELDYFTVAATEAARRLETRLQHDSQAFGSSEVKPSILICIPWRRGVVAPMLTREWIIEPDPEKADFIIETERWRCAGPGVYLIDEVKRSERTFAWTYARKTHPSP